CTRDPGINSGWHEGAFDYW
nr:immunoglobulin heavy chain junction region [Macaca mulatta]